MVAPLAGAWIEMCKTVSKRPVFAVAPLAGAWIEIRRNTRIVLFHFVAPLAGAWIEMLPHRMESDPEKGRSPRRSVD